MPLRPRAIRCVRCGAEGDPAGPFKGCPACLAVGKPSNVQVVYDDAELLPALRRGAGRSETLRDMWHYLGYEIVDGLAPTDGDLVVTKSRFSPFVETDIAQRLHAFGVENLLVGGVGTSACVESTVRDASQRDFRTYVVAEATGDISAAAHEHSLHVMGSLFGWTVSLDAVREAAGATG